MKRVEHGVPLEMLDLRICFLQSLAESRLLSEVVVDILGPETLEARRRMRYVWDSVGRGLFIVDKKFGEDGDDKEEED